MTEEINHPAYDCPEGDLGLMLHDLFNDKIVQEVTIVHPVDGPKVVTRAEYLDMIKAASSVVRESADEKHSPSENYLEKKRLERVKTQMQIRFRTAMISAEVRYINLDGENDYGFDANGKKIDIDGLTFVPISDYLEGIDLVKNELGSFIDEKGVKASVRIASN